MCLVGLEIKKINQNSTYSISCFNMRGLELFLGG